MALRPKPLEPGTSHRRLQLPAWKHPITVPLWPCQRARRSGSPCRLAVMAMAALLPSPDGAGGAPSPGPSPPLEVLVYSGEGAGYQSARNTLRALQRSLAPGVQARLVGTGEVLEGSWRERCLLFVMPGGADLPYCRHLNGRGNSLLRGYVAGGGSYLGICAGAYFACGRVEFEPGSALEVVGDRELRFFPGTARGAAYPGFDYLSERGACAAPVRFRQAPLPAQSPPAQPAVASTAPPPAPAPRLGRHHLALTQPGGVAAASAGESSGLAAAEGDIEVRQAAEDLEGGSERRQGAGSSGCGALGRSGGPTHGPAADFAVMDTGGSGGGEEYDGWVYCRDYSNGGPVFVLEDTSGGAAAAAAAGGGGGDGDGDSGSASPSSYVERDDGLEVLAVYPELENALAAVRCRVGEGVAVLCGTHPEMPHEALTDAVQLYDGQDELARHVAALGAELAAWMTHRRQLWATLLLACCTATAPAGAAAAGPVTATAGAEDSAAGREYAAVEEEAREAAPVVATIPV